MYWRNWEKNIAILLVSLCEGNLCRTCQKLGLTRTERDHIGRIAYFQNPITINPVSTANLPIVTQEKDPATTTHARTETSQLSWWPVRCSLLLHLHECFDHELAKSLYLITSHLSLFSCCCPQHLFMLNKTSLWAPQHYEGHLLKFQQDQRQYSVLVCQEH